MSDRWRLHPVSIHNNRRSAVGLDAGMDGEVKEGSMSDKYILKGKKPVPVDLMTWGKWYEKAHRSVAKTKNGGITVSTVFLGLDHQWGDGPPLLFETMVFGGEFNGEMDRYSTWEEAEIGHKTMCEKVLSFRQQSEDADREMIGNDSFFVDNVGNK